MTPASLNAATSIDVRNRVRYTFFRRKTGRNPVIVMMAKTVNITTARKEIYNIAKEVNECHEEIFVYNATNGNNMVILSEEDWKAIQETLYLNSIPNMADSIIAAAEEPLSEGIVYDESEPW